MTDPHEQMRRNRERTAALIEIVEFLGIADKKFKDLTDEDKARMDSELLKRGFERVSVRVRLRKPVNQRQERRDMTTDGKTPMWKHSLNFAIDLALAKDADECGRLNARVRELEELLVEEGERVTRLIDAVDTLRDKLKKAKGDT